MAAADVESDGSWADDPDEDQERGEALDEVLARRADLLERRRENGDWCTCGYCFPVENAFSAFDVTCCQEKEPGRDICQEHELFQDEVQYPCVTQHPSFYHLILYERELNNVAHHYQMDGVDARYVPRHEKLRYTGYRAYTAWVHGFLGRRNRIEIPHCVQKAIRRRFPDPQQEYTGFQPPELADQDGPNPNLQ